MNRKFLLFGKALKILKKALPSDDVPGIYVSYSHEVRKEDVNNFEALIQHINKDHSFISPSQFFDYLETNRMPCKKPVLMTFDDGFLSSYHAAKNLLNKYGIKAIFFIPTAILDLKDDTEMIRFTKENIYYNTIDDKELQPEEFLYMSKSHLMDLVNDGHMICPHTYSHIWIKDIVDESMVEKELLEPKILIEELLKIDINAFAFPVGTERQVGKLAYKNIYKEYEYCFTALTGINTYGGDKHKLFRFNLPPDATIDYVDMVLAGVYNIYYKLKMRMLSKNII